MKSTWAAKLSLTRLYSVNMAGNQTGIDTASEIGEGQFCFVGVFLLPFQNFIILIGIYKKYIPHRCLY